MFALMIKHNITYQLEITMNNAIVCITFHLHVDIDLLSYNCNKRDFYYQPFRWYSEIMM